MQALDDAVHARVQLVLGDALALRVPGPRATRRKHGTGASSASAISPALRLCLELHGRPGRVFCRAAALLGPLLAAAAAPDGSIPEAQGARQGSY